MLDSAGLRIAIGRDHPSMDDRARDAERRRQSPPDGPSAPEPTAGPTERAARVVDDLAQRRDLHLIERAQHGDLDAFNDLVSLHQDHLWGLVARIVPDIDQASDVVQEAFFSAWRNLRSFRGGSVRSWLGRIAINAAMDTQRLRKRRPAQPYPELEDDSWQPPAGEDADPERTAIGGERSRVLAEALGAITGDQRAAIVLYDIEGYDYAEIAGMTGVSLGTVKSRIHRGRLALRVILESRMDLFRGEG
jgi:RNA polymerase sigma-70 factor (ECF subfamily)